MGGRSCHQDIPDTVQRGTAEPIAEGEEFVRVLPKLRAISLGDRSWIEDLTRRYAPYSDFNFTSMWAWDTQGKRRIFELNGNLVLLFTDYITGKQSLSFLGSRDVERTARELLCAAPAAGMTAVLSVIGEELVPALRGDGLLVEEDVGNADYVFSVFEHSEFRGRKYSEIRHVANRFEREYPEASFEVKDLRTANVRHQILNVFAHWTERNERNDPNYNTENGYSARTIIHSVLSTPCFSAPAR